jgi:flagellar biosynthetic protein FliR
MLAQLLPVEIFAFMLVFSRVGSALMLLPGIGEAYVYPRVRLALALALSLVIYPLVRDVLPPPPAQPWLLFLIIGGEVLHGVFIGAVTRFLIMSLHVAGTVVAFLSSLAMAQTMDPNQGVQGALVSAFFSIIGITLIFVSGLHMVMIAALYDSYTLFPVGTPPPAKDFADLAVRLFARSFEIGLRMAAPFVIYALIFYIGVGLLQRLNPQIQIFFIAMPAQLGIAFFILMSVLSALFMVFLNHFESSTVHLLLAR